MIKSTEQAAAKSGMPISHAHCFQRVANQTDCMIACRSVGKYATGLILENYASKGFHIKTKSCNWGPMAGFVLSDPRFRKQDMSGLQKPQKKIKMGRTMQGLMDKFDVKPLEKTGGITRAEMNRKNHNEKLKQRKSTDKALEHGATLTPICISDRRIRDLEHMGCMSIYKLESNVKYCKASPIGGAEADIMNFVLIKIDGEYGVGGQMWGVYYHLNNNPLDSRPVLGLVNPGTNNNSYLSAVTGDYDLWGVWPRATEYEPGLSSGPQIGPRNIGLDRRPVPGSSHRPVSYREFGRHEDPDLGNITRRINQVRGRLNAAINRTGYSGGDMVHHSDEVGRPQVFEVEMDFIAFIPGQDGKARFVTNMGEFRKLMKECIANYSISINGAWQNALGFSSSMGGHYEWG